MLHCMLQSLCYAPEWLPFLFLLFFVRHSSFPLRFSSTHLCLGDVSLSNPNWKIVTKTGIKHAQGGNPFCQPERVHTLPTIDVKESPTDCSTTSFTNISKTLCSWCPLWLRSPVRANQYRVHTYSTTRCNRVINYTVDRYSQPDTQ